MKDKLAIFSGSASNKLAEGIAKYLGLSKGDADVSDSVTAKYQ